MTFADMNNFHKGREFFFLRPSRPVAFFIIVIACIILTALVWSLIAKMDDIIKASAHLRPISAISHIISVTGGEIIEKNYVNDEQVIEGDLLLRLDTSADTIDLQNTKKLMNRIESDIMVAEYLLQTINTNKNAVPQDSGEAFIRSQIYLNEFSQYQSQLDELRTKLRRENELPLSMVTKQQIEDIENEIKQAELKFSFWKNSKLVETMDAIKTLSRERETLDRRLLDLDRNIKNAVFRAPISGKINEINKFNIGDYILPGDNIIDIVPSGSASLKADLYIDPMYAARVKTAQKVSLRFPGLPPSKYGKLEAEISLIPADYVLIQNANPSFVVEAIIPEPYLTAKNGEKVYLRPGLGAEARIIISQGAVMSMILKKLDFISSSMDSPDEK
jgi:adhesin transport system membrane fusion protein